MIISEAYNECCEVNQMVREINQMKVFQKRREEVISFDRISIG